MEPDPAARVLFGDCLEVMRSLADESVDAVVSDPPYGLEFMGKAWDTFGTATPGVDKRLAASRGFQEFSALWAVEAYRVLKPGGHLLSFGGTRMYHRLAAGVEEAGFEIRDSLHWIYGSGFPKSLDVAKAIDVRLGAVREAVAVREGTSRPGFAGPTYGDGEAAPVVSFEVTKPATPEAEQWNGWGTALKPAHEPIVMARKPVPGTIADNVLLHGTGALNVRGCEIGTTGGTTAIERPKGKTDGVTSFPPSATVRADAGGRWPANVLLAHLAECEGSGPDHTELLCAPGCPVAELNAASGETVTRPHDGYESETGGRSGGIMGKTVPRVVAASTLADSGGAARFFYIAKPRRRERIGGTIRNLHVTVKPIDLMRHLVRLVTPPGGVVLDPFLGSGTTGCAAMIEGFAFIGIELDPPSYETALARISDYAFAHGRPRPAQT